LKPLFALWRETWWLWTVFTAITLVMSFAIGFFFLLILPCLPVVFTYFAYARYDMEGNEKPDLD
jgi:hypothetical protein